jgi:hypothetical protein
LYLLLVKAPMLSLLNVLSDYIIGGNIYIDTIYMARHCRPEN